MSSLLPPGGCGLSLLADTSDVAGVAHAFKILNADDPAVAGFVRSTLENAVRLKMRCTPNEGDIAWHLLVSLEGKLSLSTNRTSAALRRFGFCWRWYPARCMLSPEYPAGGVLIITPNAKRQIIGRMKAAASEHYMSALIANLEQDKEFDATSRHGKSNRFILTGQYLRFADWRFVHLAHFDVLPINGVPRWGEGNQRCLRCRYQLEMLPHMLCLCGPQAAVTPFSRGLKRPPGYPRNRELTQLRALRPDIVIPGPSRTIVVIDVTVFFEYKFDSLENAGIEKIHIYQPGTSLTLTALPWAPDTLTTTLSPLCCNSDESMHVLGDHRVVLGRARRAHLVHPAVPRDEVNSAG
ncbi:unnamed protein product [Heterotrigona itama]|uniref:Uncharacterized protein n=1 Tax=Heterotrigona itama TaxID=395501 RepID=A0A6V7H266_9HYME|nr:unnamed protein product [Heterotrigona itama]